MIPPSIQCDRMFLQYGSDAKYVESVERNLFEGDVAYLGLADRSLRGVVVRSDDVLAWKTSYSVTDGSRASVPYRDFFVLRGKLGHVYDVMMAGRSQNRTLLMLPFSLFPSLPVEVASALPPQGLSVRIHLVAFYFAKRVQSAPDSVRIRYDVAFLLEWAHSVAAALTLDGEAHALVWRCSLECIELLERFVSLDDFFVEAGNCFVVSVSFRSLTGTLRRVHEFSSAELTSRQDYPSGVTVAWAVVNPGGRRGGRNGRNFLDVIGHRRDVTGNTERMTTRSNEKRDDGYQTANRRNYRPHEEH